MQHSQPEMRQVIRELADQLLLKAATDLPNEVTAALKRAQQREPVGTAKAQLDTIHWPELGLPEAVWELNVDNPGALIVAIDSTGTTLYGAVMKEAKNRLEGCYQRLGIKDPQYRYIHWPPALAGTQEVSASLAKTGGGE